MTTLTAPADFRLSSRRRSKLAWAAADSLAVARRNVIGMTRRPQVLAFATIQPVLFVLLFRYVFGSSIHIPGVSYANYLMAGIFVQTVMFGAQSTAVGMAEDLHNGLIERFQSLPMARSAVLAGRVLADALLNLLGIALMLGVGYLIGFRLAPPHRPPRVPLQCFLADAQHARPAARLRRPPTPHRHRRHHPAVAARGTDCRARDSGRPVVRRHHRRLRPHRGAPVPAGRLSDQITEQATWTKGSVPNGHPWLSLCLIHCRSQRFRGDRWPAVRAVQIPPPPL